MKPEIKTKNEIIGEYGNMRKRWVSLDYLKSFIEYLNQHKEDIENEINDFGVLKEYLCLLEIK